MISHDQCRDLLGEYLDQSLDSSGQEKVAAHLESCADCAQIARELNVIRATLRDFKAVPAPPLLRQNVRAALQSEQRARAARPQFAWRLPQLALPQLASRQFAWSGTLAFSALALFVLARPFDTTPGSFSETAAPPESGLPVAPMEKTPAASTPATKPGLLPKNAPRRPQQEKSTAPKGKIPAPTSGRAEVSPAPRARLETLRPSAESLTAPRPLPSTAQAPQGQRPQPSLVAPKVRSAPAFPRQTPIAPKSAALDRAKRGSAPATSATRAQNANAGASPALPARPVPSQPLFQSRIADSSAASREAEIRGDTNLASESERETRFSLQLKAAALPKSVPGGDSVSKEAAPQISPPEMQRGAGENSNPVAADAPLANASGATARTRALRPMPRSAPSFVEKNTPRDGVAAFSAPNPIAPSSPVLNRVRRFELQISAPRAVSNARIRLELPSEVRLVWPRSLIVWSGDLVPEKPSTISFSLAEARGGEKISVVMEQKLASGQSRILETQNLTLPAPERE